MNKFVNEKLIGILEKISNEKIEIDNPKEFRLTEKLSFNSVAFIKMIIEIEEAFDIEIDDQYLLLEKFDCYFDLYNFINDTIYSDKNRIDC